MVDLTREAVTVTRKLVVVPVAIAAVVVLGLLIFPFAVSSLYLQHLAILVFMYVALSGSWNIIGGYAGYESFGHITFYGIGAYSSSLLLVHFGWSPLLTAPLAGLIACLAGVIALPSLRVRGAYFAITTLALAFVTHVLVSNLDWLTGGGRGIFLPLPPWEPEVMKRPFYYAMLGGALGALVLCWMVKRSKFGLCLELIREDEEKAEAIGVNTTRYKAVAFLLSTYFPGYVGAIHSYYLSYISPADAFSIIISINILLFAFFGGRGTILGPALGVLVLVPASQFLNIAVGSELHQLLFGTILIATVLLFPGGIISLVTEAARRTGLSFAMPTLDEPPATDAAPSPAARSGNNGVGEPLLQLDRVSKRFGGVTALDGCSLAVAQGSITGLIGPNGSGKSSVLNIMTGFYHADDGEVRYRGRSLLGRKPHQIRRLGIARSFQETRVFARLSVLENAAAATRAGALLGLLEPRISPPDGARALRHLEMLGLSHLKDMPAGERSYGQQKLLDLAGTFADDAECVLLDEPAAGINPVLSERMMHFLKAQNFAGRTILIIDHDMGLIMSYCEPVIVMDAGQKIAEGPPAVVQADQKVLDAYLGE